MVVATRAPVAGLRGAWVKRVDTPRFPSAWNAIALAHRNAFDIYRSEASELDWSNVSPTTRIEPGSQGQSRISVEDFAIAVLDEVENPDIFGSSSRWGTEGTPGRG